MIKRLIRCLFFPRLEVERTKCYTQLMIANHEDRWHAVDEFNKSTDTFNNQRYWWQSARRKVETI